MYQLVLNLKGPHRSQFNQMICHIFSQKKMKWHWKFLQEITVCYYWSILLIPRHILGHSLDNSVISIIHQLLAARFCDFWWVWAAAVHLTDSKSDDVSSVNAHFTNKSFTNFHYGIQGQDCGSLSYSRISITFLIEVSDIC